MDAAILGRSCVMVTEATAAVLGRLSGKGRRLSVSTFTSLVFPFLLLHVVPSSSGAAFAGFERGGRHRTTLRCKHSLILTPEHPSSPPSATLRYFQPITTRKSRRDLFLLLHHWPGHFHKSLFSIEVDTRSELPSLYLLLSLFKRYANACQFLASEQRLVLVSWTVRPT
ncbi:hypothetical protein M427DRAFT_341216 [Gonapodya prolifera JEL478]|uniref:Uncharacterized protein n=1 Tax=Gonapodya prolifera (strain JEL478) TaxID=1344416 RepID=A0A139AC66_GONPJ|nr:hypothetical protein M427DRAFT_341216 [Gonapodya prolifera JEL478]|eukprot:KXS14396.1 hypothetical protein M427DRAFT_341216 [Gonapodya prolifera JEL478]